MVIVTEVNQSKLTLAAVKPKQSRLL